MYTEVRDIPLVSQLTPSLPLDSNVGVSILTAPRLHGSDNENSKFAFSSSVDAKSWLGEKVELVYSMKSCLLPSHRFIRKHEANMTDLLIANQI